MSDLSNASGLTPEYYTYVQRYNWAICGALATFVYEIFITFDDEIRFVWKSNWSLPKCLFLIARYFSLAVIGTSLLGITRVNSAAFCSIYAGVDFFCVLIVGFTCDGLLLMRVIALYKQHRRLCRTLYSLYALAYMVEVLLTALDFYFSIHSPSATGALLDCSSTSVSSEQNLLVALATLPVLLFNALLFTLTLVHLFPYWRARDRSGTNLLWLFLTQGTVYFAITFTAFLLETVLSLEGLSPTLGPWLVLIPIASNRLFLSLRKEASSSSQEIETDRSLSNSRVHVNVLRTSDTEDAEGYVLRDFRRETMS